MTKYDEIMNEVNLTPEAKERIIKNAIEALDAPEKRSRARKSSWKKYLTVAACCLLVIAGAKTASDAGLLKNVLGGSSSDESYIDEPAEDYGANEAAEEADETSLPTANIEMEEPEDAESFDSGEEKSVRATWDAEFLNSEEELSETLGFSMSCSSLEKLSLDQGMTTVNYIAYGDYMGEITFDDGDRQNYFRKSEGDEDISGDYNEYAVSAEFDGEKTSGTLKGDKADSYKLACWTSADGFTYAAYVDEGLNEKEWFEIIEEMTDEEE